MGASLNSEGSIHFVITEKTSGQVKSSLPSRSVVCIHRYDLRRKILAVCRFVLFGLRPSEFIGKHMHDTIDRAHAQAVFPECMNGPVDILDTFQNALALNVAVPLDEKRISFDPHMKRFKVFGKDVNLTFNLPYRIFHIFFEGVPVSVVFIFFPCIVLLAADKKPFVVFNFDDKYAVFICRVCFRSAPLFRLSPSGGNTRTTAAGTGAG